MARMEAYIKKWYDYLKAGKIMGLKCRHCGAYEFPPVPVCNICSSTEMEWVEMSGEAEAVSYTFAPMGIPPFHTDPVINVMVRMKEGPDFLSWIPDLGRDACDAIFKQLPIPVKAEIYTLDENISYPVFRLVNKYL